MYYPSECLFMLSLFGLLIDTLDCYRSLIWFKLLTKMKESLKRAPQVCGDKRAPSTCLEKSFRKKLKLPFFAVKWFLIAAQRRFAISLASDTGTEPEFLECRSFNLELQFKSKTFVTNQKSATSFSSLIASQSIDPLKVAKFYHLIHSSLETKYGKCNPLRLLLRNNFVTLSILAEVSFAIVTPCHFFQRKLQTLDF